ncbi:MAG: HMA2 domain-containing protein [Desulfobacteraceae bacterium]
MEVEGIKVTHAIPGRVRLKIARLKNNQDLARVIHHRLSAISGVQKVEVSTRTGSLLVLFDPQEIISLESLQTLSELLPEVAPGLDVNQLADWLTDPPAHQGNSPLAHSLVSGLGIVNTSVRNATGGLIDFKVLLPLTLGFFGLRALLIAEEVLWPTWFDLCWFSLATFVMLNRPVVEEK